MAGAVKGVIGMGLPTISLALLAATLGLHQAMALLLFPSFATNLWQALAGGALLASLRRLGTLLAAVSVGVWFGAGVLARTDTALLTALLGVLICIYSAQGLARPRVVNLGRSEPWLSPAVGAANGVPTGLTGSFVVPGVLYMQSLDMPRDDHVQAMGILFAVSTAALAVSLGDHRLLSLDAGALSLGAAVPVLIGMTVGRALRRRLSEAVFKNVFLGSLLTLGVYLVVSAWRDLLSVAPIAG